MRKENNREVGYWLISMPWWQVTIIIFGILAFIIGFIEIGLIVGILWAYWELKRRGLLTKVKKKK